jgi:hypothetical protein
MIYQMLRAGTNKIRELSDGCPMEARLFDSPSVTVGGFGSSDVNRNILNWETIMQVPPMKKTEREVNGKKIEEKEPDITAGSQKKEDIAQKKAWFAGVRYCYKIAGPRPTPPTKEAMDTPEGRVRRRNGSTARRSRIISSECARIVWASFRGLTVKATTLRNFVKLPRRYARRPWMPEFPCRPISGNATGA